VIISVASGRGGTGKTLVATSLARSLNGRDNVQLLDCDVEEPNAHIFLKPAIIRSEIVSIPVPKLDGECTHCGKCTEVCAYNAIAIDKEKLLIFPELCHGCGACSYLCPESAISEEGKEIGVVELGYSDAVEFAHGRLSIGEAMARPIIGKVKEYASNKGTVIIDVPSETSCLVEAVKDSDFCLLVTESTTFGLNDLVLAVEMVRKLNIPCGVVLNRAGVGDRMVEECCHKQHIPILLTIPLDNEIASLYSKGITLVEGIPQWREGFLGLWGKIREIVNARASGVKR